MYTNYDEDARICGINLTGKVAIAPKDADGRLVMVDIISPVTLAVYIYAGTTMDAQLIDLCYSLGIDWVVVYEGTHKRNSLSLGWSEE